MVSMDNRIDPSIRGPDLRLLIRDLRDRQGKKRSIVVRSWSTVKDVKDAIQQELHVPPSSQRLFFGPVLTSRGELPNHRTLQDAGIYRSGETLMLDIKDSVRSEASARSPLTSMKFSNDVCVSSSIFDLTPRRLRSLVEHTRRGLSMGLKPEFVLDGSGGTYFLRNSRKERIAVFKPADEEPFAENNPRGYLPQPGQTEFLREGIVPGEACVREVAAYLLDHGGLCGVPMTTLVEARHPTFNTNGSRLNVSQGGASLGSHSIGPLSPMKTILMKKAGSFQEYVPSEGTMDDISPSKISAFEIQKIAILDIRIMNADRNSANLLVHRRPDDTLELIPIDHGFSLRTVCDVSWMDWCWLDWPQLKEPICNKLKKYIEALDIEADARLLHENLNIPGAAIDYFRASSALLKTGARAGLSLYDIACMCCRNDNLAEVPSMMENMFSMASELAQVAIENERWHHTAASRALAQQLTHDESSLLFLPNKRSNGASFSRMTKSASSAAFLGSERENSSHLGNHQDMVGSRASPALAQSSGSDTSSEADHDTLHEDDCDKWAEGVMKQITPITPIGRPKRSYSIESDDASASDSDSPKGFWHTQPGSPHCSDDSSTCWSPVGSFREDMLSCGEPPEIIPSVAKEKVRQSVRFESILPSSGPFIPPATVSVSKIKVGGNSDLDSELTSGAIPQMGGLIRSVSKIKIGGNNELDSDLSSSSFTPQTDGGGLIRRSSVSGLSSLLTRSPDLAVQRKNSQTLVERDATFCEYFHKFIDLVIERETTSAMVQASKRKLSLDNALTQS